MANQRNFAVSGRRTACAAPAAASRDHIRRGDEPEDAENLREVVMGLDDGDRDRQHGAEQRDRGRDALAPGHRSRGNSHCRPGCRPTAGS